MEGGDGDANPGYLTYLAQPEDTSKALALFYIIRSNIGNDATLVNIYGTASIVINRQTNRNPPAGEVGYNEVISSVVNWTPQSPSGFVDGSRRGIFRWTRKL